MCSLPAVLLFTRGGLGGLRRGLKGGLRRGFKAGLRREDLEFLKGASKGSPKPLKGALREAWP